MTTLRIDAYEPEQSGELTLWAVAAVIVVAIHIGLAVAYLWLRPKPEMRAEAPAIDVAFMPATNAPAAPPSVDQPDPVPAKMDLPKDPLPPPIPELQAPPPTPQVEAMVPPPEPPPPAPSVPVQPELPPPPAIPEPTAIVPVEKPPEVTVPEKPVVAAPSPKVTHEEKIEKREKAERREEKADRHQLPPKSVAAPGNKPMRVASAPNAGVESEGARVGLESWLSEFASQIRRFATYPTGSTGSGTAQVSVTVSRNGRLISHRLVASAGSAALDHAAMAAIERAQPFPPFPASMAEAQITRVVPLHLRPQ